MADLKEISFRQLGTVRCCLGESPLWDVQRQCLYFIDIDGKTRFSMDLETQTCNTKILPQQTGCIALCEDGSLLYAMQDGVYRETADGFVRIHDPFVIAGERFNDGAVAPDGSFLVGTTSASGQGKLYRIAHGVVELIFLRMEQPCIILTRRPKRYWPMIIRICNGKDWYWIFHRRLESRMACVWIQSESFMWHCTAAVGYCVFETVRFMRKNGIYP